MNLRVHSSGRLLADEFGRPFFYLADTAWELFHRLSREEAELYLTTRAAQGFNVIQCVALAEHDGLRQPNFDGHVPFVDLNPSKPDDRYWRHVDWLIDRAASLGLWTGLLPTWGDKIWLGWSGAAGPEVFNLANARDYGRFIGSRYRDRPIMWIMGGDRAVQSSHYLLTVREMAMGIREVDPSHLMTFHPTCGQSSSLFVHSEPWLDFNMLQSGHTGRDIPVWRMVDLDRARLPVKPVLDGEPNYEDHPVMRSPPGGGWVPTPGQWFDDFDVRKQAWRSVLAGACGHAYGCHDVWQFFDPSRNPAINIARTSWQDALDLPGAKQMRHVKRLFERIDWDRLSPDLSLVRQEESDLATRGAAMSGDDGRLALVYLPAGAVTQLDARTTGRQITWLDVQTGEETEGGEVKAGQVQPPDARDWLLILGAANAVRSGAT
jgi:hypothetical protein